MVRFNGSILGSPRSSNTASASGVWSVNNIGIAQLNDAWPGIILQDLRYGYTSGGQSPTVRNTIDKFSFSSNANATDVGNLTLLRYGPAGQSSTSSGYTSGGVAPGGRTNTIDKFPFASDGNATDVGDLTIIRNSAAGQSSSGTGYTSGGILGPTTFINTIDKFPFSVSENSTDVGDLTLGRYGAAGQQG